MTTLNTIIEEEKEAFREKMLSCTHVGGFNSCVLDNDKEPEYTLADNAEAFLTTAMQRAYEAGQADWLRSEIEKLEQVEAPMESEYELGAFHEGFFTALTTIITRYKEELLELESK